MKRRLVTAVYWFVLGANALFWLTEIARHNNDLADSVILILIGLGPLAILPVIRWIKTGEWHIDPR